MMAKNSADYWKKRLLEQEERSQEIDDRYLKLMQQELAEYQRSVIKDIEAFYMRYATDYKMSLADAEAYLTDNERIEFQNVSLEAFRKMGQNPYFDQRLRDALAYRHRISRKEALLAEIEAKTMDVFGKRDGLVDYTFKNMGQVYGSQKIDIAKGVAELGFSTRTPIVDLNTLKNKLRVNWSGKNLSQTVWGHSDKLFDDIADVLEDGFIGGWELDDIIDRITERTGVARSRAETLVRTESNAFNSMGAVDEMRNQGVKKYRNVVTIDTRTSEICQAVHKRNKSYTLDEYEIGLTAPPFHVRCRTIIEPDTTDEFDYFQTPDPNAPTMDDVFEMWEEALEDTVNELNHLVVDEDLTDTHIFETTDTIRFQAKRVANDKFDIWTQGQSKRYTDTTKLLIETLPDFKQAEIPRIVIANSSKLDSLATYNQADDILYLNNRINSKDAAERLLKDRYFASQSFKDILTHELASKKHWDAVKRLQASKPETYRTLEEAKHKLEEPIRKFVAKEIKRNPNYLEMISSYASDTYFNSQSVDEVIAESYVLDKTNALLKLIKEVLNDD